MLMLWKMLAMGAAVAAQQNICIHSCGPHANDPARNVCIELCGPQVAAPVAGCANALDLSQACNSQYLGFM
jgi:hypothetical protein